jgi:hypothetical protein
LNNRGFEGTNFGRFLEKHFSSWKPFSRGVSHENVSVIKDESLLIPFQNRETIISHACETILYEGNKTLVKGYPMIGICRGSGCGKSRMIEECRLWCDINRLDVLFSAITFNNKITTAVKLQWNNKPVSLAFAIICRIIASYYGRGLTEVCSILSNFNFKEFIKTCR